MYLRKSTDDEAKQVRSLEDQQTECQFLADQIGAKVRDEGIFIKSASAKKSDNRQRSDASSSRERTRTIRLCVVDRATVR